MVRWKWPPPHLLSKPFFFRWIFCFHKRDLNRLTAPSKVFLNIHKFSKIWRERYRYASERFRIWWDLMQFVTEKNCWGALCIYTVITQIYMCWIEMVQRDRMFGDVSRSTAMFFKMASPTLFQKVSLLLCVCFITLTSRYFLSCWLFICLRLQHITTFLFHAFEFSFITWQIFTHFLTASVKMTHKRDKATTRTLYYTYTHTTLLTLKISFNSSPIVQISSNLSGSCQHEIIFRHF